MDSNERKLQSESFYGTHGSRPITLTPDEPKIQQKRRRLKLADGEGKRTVDITDTLLLVSKKMRLHPMFAQQENLRISAGFTYIGQFIAHDITYHRNTTGFNIPRLRLDVMYGGGPAIHAFLFNHYGDDIGYESKKYPKEYWDAFRRTMFRMKRYGNLYDVIRLNRKVPIIADVRNDQNFITSQLHVAFMRFHNAMVKYYHGLDVSLTSDALFEKTKKSVINHYQWMVIHQYLKQIVYDPELIDRLLNKDNKAFLLYNPTTVPALMEEFFAAAFRVGHSQVLNSYSINDALALKIFDYKNRHPQREEDLTDLRGFTERQKTCLDWSKFFFWYKQGLDDKQTAVTMAGKYDLQIADALGALIFRKYDNNSLIEANLKRFPRERFSAHDHATAMYSRLPNYANRMISPEDVLHTVDSLICNGSPKLTPEQRKTLTPENLPLWLYLLIESSVLENGDRLGPLGSHIVAEQMIWTLKRDENSCINIEKGKWHPESIFEKMQLELNPLPDQGLPDGIWNAQNNKFSMQHLFKFLEESE